MSKSKRYDSTRQQENSYGVPSQECEQILLDDLPAEIQQLADAVEEQHELLEQQRAEVEQ